jgi:hypothetical protein
MSNELGPNAAGVIGSNHPERHNVYAVSSQTTLPDGCALTSAKGILIKRASGAAIASNVRVSTMKKNNIGSRRRAALDSNNGNGNGVVCFEWPRAAAVVVKGGGGGWWPGAGNDIDGGGATWTGCLLALPYFI